MSCDTQLLFVEKMEKNYHIYNLQWLGSTVNEHQRDGQQSEDNNNHHHIHTSNNKKDMYYVPCLDQPKMLIHSYKYMKTKLH